ncbi:MAG: porin family protein [Deltaproteobacteria bacterium]|nr:porin family protein [Deltaproteobacteria bacterium]
MKKIIFGLIGCLFLAMPAISLGETGMYGSFNAGFAMPVDGDMTLPGTGSVELEYDTSFTVGGAIGYMVENYRLEGEVAYQNNEVDSIEGFSLPLDLGIGILNSMEVSVLTFLANGYYDFDTGSAFTPLITAGLGFARIEGEMTVDGLSGDEDDTVFAYQLGVGAGYAVSETVSLDCKYRYLGTADPDFDGVEIEVASHNITVGIRVAF